MRLIFTLPLLLAALPAFAEECTFTAKDGRQMHVFVGDAHELTITTPDGQRIDTCSWDSVGTYCDSGTKPPIERPAAHTVIFANEVFVLACPAGSGVVLKPGFNMEPG